MLCASVRFKIYEANPLLDTGAIQSALSESELRKITTAHSEMLLWERPVPDFKIQIANGYLINIEKQVLLQVFLAGSSFEGTFLILPTVGMVVIRLSFSETYTVTNHLKKSLSTPSPHFNAGISDC